MFSSMGKDTFERYERNCVPLKWPDWWTNMGQWRRFLMGTPIIGPQSRLRGEIVAELKRRGKDCEHLWGNCEERLGVFRRCSTIIRDRLHWPNAHFLPADRLDVLLWDGLFDGLPTVEAVLALEQEFHLDEDFALVEYASQGKTLGDLVQSLCYQSTGLVTERSEGDTR